MYFTTDLLKEVSDEDPSNDSGTLVLEDLAGGTVTRKLVLGISSFGFCVPRSLMVDGLIFGITLFILVEMTADFMEPSERTVESSPGLTALKEATTGFEVEAFTCKRFFG